MKNTDEVGNFSLPSKSPEVEALYQEAERRRQSDPERFDVSPEHLIERVLQKRGESEDVVCSEVLPALAELLASGLNDGRLNALGTELFLNSLERKLAQRLDLEAHFQANPQLQEQRIVRPIFLVGFWRTGTTFLQRLLSNHPGLRSLRAWELVLPIEAATSAPEEHPQLIEIAQRGHDRLARLNPTMMLVHEFRADLPEECIVAMGTDFKSWFFSNETRLPSYDRWLATQDLTDSYELYGQILKLLQSGYVGKSSRSAPRFLLKAPAHTPELDALLRIFPDATLIQLHRPLRTTLASTASLFAVHHSTRTDQIDPLEIGRFVTEQHKFFTKRAEASRTRGAEILDLRYEDLVASPIELAMQVFRHLELETNVDVLRGELERHLTEHQQHRLGKHRYSPEQFGLEAIPG